MADPLKDWLNKHVGGTGTGTSAISELLTPNAESPSSSAVSVDASEVTPSVESSEASSTSAPVQPNVSSISPTKEQIEKDAAENKAQQAETLEVRKPRTLQDAIDDFSENTLAPAYGAIGKGIAGTAMDAGKGIADAVTGAANWAGKVLTESPEERGRYTSENFAYPESMETYDSNIARDAFNAYLGTFKTDPDFVGPRKAGPATAPAPAVDQSSVTEAKFGDNAYYVFNRGGDYKDVDPSWVAGSNPQGWEAATTEQVPDVGNDTSALVDLTNYLLMNPEYIDARSSLYKAMDEGDERKAQAAAQAAGSLDDALAKQNVKGEAAIDLLNRDIDEAHQEKLDQIIEGYDKDGSPIYKGGWEKAADTSWISSSNPNVPEMSSQQGLSTKDWKDASRSIFMNGVKLGKMADDAGRAVSEDHQSLANRSGSINTVNPLATDYYTLQNDQGLIETINDQGARDENNRRADEHAEKAAEAKGQFLEDSGVQNVDDGTNDKAHRMANKITGEELNRQIESGQVSQPDSAQIKIDNDTVYYKSDLTRRGMKGLQYDLAGAVLDDIATMPNTIQNTVRDARENLTSYGVNIDGIELNSKDIKNADLNDQVARIQEEYQENPMVYLPEAEYWYDLNNRIVPYGEEGALGYLNEDGNCIVTLMDGTELIFSGNENETPTQEAQRIMKTDLEGIMNGSDSRNNTWVKGYAAKPVYVGDKELTFDQAHRLLTDMSTMDSGGGGFRSDSGISYDYGTFNIAKPSVAYDDDDQWAKMTTDALPYFTDLVTGSAPIMIESALRNAPHPALKALGYLAPFSSSAAYTAASGLDPYGDRKGGYRKTVGELSDEVKEALRNQGINPDEYQKDRKNKQIPQQVASNYALSLTEDLWGGIGKSALSTPLKGIGNALAKKSRTARKAGEKIDTSRFLQTVKGGVGEGLEEIPGNIAEEGTRSGLLSWYGDYLRDENGNLIADESGNLLKEQRPSEGVSDRFWEEAPEAFWGGAMLGVPMSFLGSKGVVKANKAKHAANRNKYEDADGKFSATAYDLYNNKAGE